MKVSAYIGLVVVDVAVVERDCAAVDVGTTSVLPNNKHIGEKEAPQRGDGVVSCVGSGQLTFCEHTREPYRARQ